jgi:hypothetical protein
MRPGLFPTLRDSPALLAFVLALAWLPRPAAAAEGYEACAHVVTGLPTVISTPGTWCLEQDLDSPGGIGVRIDVDDVVLDCNGFRLEGDFNLSTSGIQATNRRNVTVRHCHVRNFRDGIRLDQEEPGISQGHLVEGNRIIRSRRNGAYVVGDGSVVRDNLVVDTRFWDKFQGSSWAISTVGDVDIVGNTVEGVYNEGIYDGESVGILVDDNDAGSVRGNRVRDVERYRTYGNGYGIRLHNPKRVVVRGNVLAGNMPDDSVFGQEYIGIQCDTTVGGGVPTTRAKDNKISGFGTAVAGCSNDGNVIRH